VSIEDKQKWDKKYTQHSELLKPREPSVMVKKYANALKEKKALDLACGAGRNALFLANRGFTVDAVDISKVALNILKSRAESNINIINADLDNYTPSKEQYTLIVKTNFLDRELIERSKDALKSGGIFIVETYIEDKDNEKKDSNPNFLLKKDELLKIFKNGFEVLEYKTFWNESFEKYRMKKASIVCRKL